jgi:sugar/nucleoside kinase (ribokinase family)
MVGIIGDIMQDFILYIRDYPEAGTETSISESTERIGGSACNTAMVLGDLNSRVYLYSQVGDDTVGSAVIDTLCKKNVSTTFVSIHPTMASGFIMIAVSDGGQRTMFSYRPKEPLPDSEDSEDAFIKQITLLHLSGYIFLGERERSICDRIIRKAKKKGIPILLDPGISPVKRIPDYVTQKLAEVDFFLPDERELRFLTGESMPEEGVKKLKRNLGNTAVQPVIVVKRGKEGCEVYTQDNRISIPAIHSVISINSTGAGDAFNAGFIYGLIHEFPLDRCALIANEMGYQVVKTPESIAEKHFDFSRDFY